MRGVGGYAGTMWTNGYDTLWPMRQSDYKSRALVCVSPWPPDLERFVL